MRTLCFDTESNFHLPDRASIETRRHAISEIAGGVFYGAVVYYFERRAFFEFRGHEIPALVRLLGSADLLLSHSGKRRDLLVLEYFCGQKTISPLWKIQHFDLYEEESLESVEDAAARVAPKQEAQATKVWRANWRKADEEGRFIDSHLINARYDTEMTAWIGRKNARFNAIRKTIRPRRP